MIVLHDVIARSVDHQTLAWTWPLLVNDMRSELRVEISGINHERCVPSLEAAILAVLPDAMLRAESITLPGRVDEMFLTGLHDFMQAFHKLFPCFKPIEIHQGSKEERPISRDESSHFGLGFSCGIDSFYALLELQKGLGDKFVKNVSLLFFDVGSHGCGDYGQHTYTVRKARVEEIAKQLGIRILHVKTNLGELSKVPFDRCYPIRNACAARMVASLIGTYVIAGTNCMFDSITEPSNPLTDPLLSSPAQRIWHQGASASRFDKTAAIAGDFLVQSFLDVCVSPLHSGRNCSTCTKCLRAMLTLKILGIDELFKSVFDFTEMEARRGPFIQRMRRHGKTRPNSYWVEIEEVCKARGIDLSAMEDSPAISGERILQMRHVASRHDVIEGILAAQRKLHILEIGCGAACFRKRCEASGHSYVGLDLTGHRANINWSIDSLPFEEDEFDVILAFSVFQYTPVPQKVIADLSRCLKSGGLLAGTISSCEPGVWEALVHLTPSGLESILKMHSMRLESTWPSWSILEAFRRGLAEAYEGMSDVRSYCQMLERVETQDLASMIRQDLRFAAAFGFTAFRC